ncbi:MAG: uracil-DNA glycosylase [Gammaproteobacteria bacterium]|nr:uracil-DNA glycosylase [Gammaproteobacteria bacterium]
MMHDALFNLSIVDPSWLPYLDNALKKMDQSYLHSLAQQNNWLPGREKIFAAFSLPVEHTQYILFGESPYPRPISANGYAFWDAHVDQLWSSSGLTKQVNRATSLRNIIKMLLVAEGLLPPDQTTQDNIAQLNKQHLIQTNHELFSHLLTHGFLLLNATLVLRSGTVKQDALAWQPFIDCLLTELLTKNPDIQLILLGKVASLLQKTLNHLNAKALIAEHPYNLSFIQNPEILQFFRPFHLLLE